MDKDEALKRSCRFCDKDMGPAQDQGAPRKLLEGRPLCRACRMRLTTYRGFSIDKLSALIKKQCAGLMAATYVHKQKKEMER